MGEAVAFADSLHPKISHVLFDPEAEESIGTMLNPYGPFDLVVSNLALHWMNDLPGVLGTLKSLLKPDGLFIGTMYGGDTLAELRVSLQMAEMEREGGISPHVSPLASSQTMASMLTSLGFQIVSADVDTEVVHYADAFKLMEDLQLMGENNAVGAHRGYLSRETAMAAAAIYHELFYNPEASGVAATFEVVNLQGWAPGGVQPTPLPPH